MNPCSVCLVVEDDCDIRDLLCLILSRAGFEVAAEAAGTAGHQTARKLDPVLITLNIGLPDLDGFEVAHRIRKFSAARIVMITASPDPRHEQELLASGVSVPNHAISPAGLVELAQQLRPQVPAERSLPARVGS